MFSVKFDKSGGVRVSTMASVSACWRIYTSNCNLKAKTYTRLANWETVSKMSCPINPFFFGDRSRFLDWVWVKAVWDRTSTLFKISQDILNTVIGILDEPLKVFVQEISDEIYKVIQHPFPRIEIWRYYRYCVLKVPYPITKLELRNLREDSVTIVL